MVAAQPQTVTSRVVDDGRTGHAIYTDRSLGIDIEHLTKISRHFEGFLVGRIPVGLIVQTVLADLELDMRIVAGSLRSAAASPRTIIPRHGLHGSHSSVGELSDPEIQTCLLRDMVPVIAVGVLAQLIQQGRSVRGTIIRLNVSLQPGVICAGRMPKHALRCELARAFVTGALGHHADQRLVILIVFHIGVLSPASAGIKIGGAFIPRRVGYSSVFVVRSSLRTYRRHRE